MRGGPELMAFQSNAEAIIFYSPVVHVFTCHVNMSIATTVVYKHIHTGSADKNPAKPKRGHSS